MYVWSNVFTGRTFTEVIILLVGMECTYGKTKTRLGEVKGNSLICNASFYFLEGLPTHNLQNYLKNN